MHIKTDHGVISISNEVIAAIAGNAASSCFGVKGMTTTSRRDGIVHLLRREHMTTGVNIRESGDGGIEIGLHIAVDHGINIQAVGKSILSEVQYHVERLTGIPVRRVDIYVDSIRA